MPAQRTLSRDQARELDRRAVDEYAMASLVLMENAGRGVADRLCALGIAGRVLVCCGPGNNGGDGFVVARHLDLRGIKVEVLVVAEQSQLRGDALSNLEIIQHAGLQIRHCPDGDFSSAMGQPDWIVDALLGTGARGEPRPAMARVIAAINASQTRVMAVDLPSGLDCDSGTPASQSVRASHTCTFVGWKRGFLNPSAGPYLGDVHVVDIGAPRKLVDEVVEQPS
ncbi:MAG TPA: NAD(P)H-hydrate epimerase [Pirellulales bacterium]|jgi:NAD(P)H-hydrate epimerase